MAAFGARKPWQGSIAGNAKICYLVFSVAFLLAACGTFDRSPSGQRGDGTFTGQGGAYGATPAEWLRLPDAPTARTEVGAVFLDGSIYVAGGIAKAGGGGRVLSTFEVFDISSSTWRRLPDLPEPRHHAAVAALDKTVYVVGGFSDMAFTADSKVFAFNVESGRWRLAAPLPEPLGAGGAAALDGKIYFVGGVDVSGKTSSRLYVFDGNSWRRLRDMPTPREHLAVAATSSFLYAIGGRHPITAAAERYDPDEDSWESLPPKPTPRGGVAGAGVGGRFACVAGGEDETRTYPDAECFDESAGRWMSLPPMNVARHGIGAAGTEKNFYTIAGGDKPGLAETAALESFTVNEMPLGNG
ncbi:MAG: hypothetical protein C4317_00325 [Acidimicrobiia bacterium]